MNLLWGIMNTPLVSVVITTFNRLYLLERALSSLENQTFSDFEVIISDDCSDVDVKSFIKKYREHSSLSIIYRCNSQNRGACYTRNEGIKIARGKFIAGLDDDDEFTANRLEVLLSIYKPEYSFVTSNTLVIAKNRKHKLFRRDRVINFNDLMWGNIVGTQVLVERKRILALGGFDTNLTSAQDADMWIRLVKKFGCALRVKESLYVLHTEHEEGRISTSENKVNGLINAFTKHSESMSDSQRRYHEYKIFLYKNNRKINFSTLKLSSIQFLPYLIYKKMFI